MKLSGLTLLRIVALLAVLTAGGIALFAPPSLHVLAMRADAFLRDHAQARLDRRHGLCYLESCDEPVGLHVTPELASETTGAKAVDGRTGRARRFRSGNDAVFRLPVNWQANIGSTGGVAFWFNAHASAPTQTVFAAGQSGAPDFFFRIEGDRLRVQLPLQDGVLRLSGPYDALGRYAHMALTFSPEAARLYLDGVLLDEQKLSGPCRIPGRLVAFYGTAPDSICGDLDDLCLWNREPLPRTIRKLARSPFSAAATLEPLYTPLQAAARRCVRGFSSFCRALDRLNPRTSRELVFRNDLPVLSVKMTSADARHFVRRHEESLQSGYRTARADRMRDVVVTWQGRTERCEMSLDDGYTHEHAARRPSYLIAAPASFLADGSGTIRLLAPEAWAQTHPDAPGLLPGTTNGLVRFFVDNTFRGLYFVEPFDRNGSAWKAYGPRSAEQADALHFSGAFGRSAPTNDAAQMRALLAGDVHFPWSRTGMEARERLHQAARTRLGFAPVALNAFDLLGGNRAPFFLTESLDLRAAGSDVRWESSRPEVLDATGRLLARPASVPEVVTLTARGGIFGETPHPFTFRVMPEHRTLPVFMVYVAEPLSKTHRTDFTCLYWPAGTGEPEWRNGFCGRAGGGAKTRGNTSFIKGRKRSFSLEFDTPHGLIGDPGLEHLNFFSGYSDPSRLRNAFSFELFRATAEAGAHPNHFAPTVAWAEVFINGEYFGLYEFGNRLDEKLISSAQVILRASRPSRLFHEENPRVFTQLWPKPEDADATGWYAPEARFVRETDAQTFCAQAAARYDLPAIADFLLVLQLTQNFDGRITNVAVCRDGAGRIFFVPWDYDKSFTDEPFQRLTHSLTERLLRDVPEFRALLAARWRTFRAGPFRTERLEARLQEWSEVLAPYQELDRQFAAAFADADAPAAALENLRRNLRRNLEAVDAWVGSLEPATP